MPTPLLELERISAGYNTEPVLADANLCVREHEVVALMGKSGCGKTTLIRVAAGLLMPRTGTVRMNIGSADRYSVMFQSPLLQPWLTVEQNVQLPCKIAGIPVTTKQLLDVVGLGGHERKFPWELSGGMQRRAALARALVVGPQLLLLDEPFAGVDELTRETLYELLGRLVESRRLSCLFVTHNVHEAVYLADRVAVMHGNPASVTDVIPVTLSRPRTSELREDRDFISHVMRIRLAIRAGENHR